MNAEIVRELSEDSQLDNLNYKPTKKEQRLIDVLRNGRNRALTISDLCEKAGCDDNVYYRAMRKPGFRVHLIGLGLDYWMLSFPGIAQTMAFQAKGGMFAQQKYIADQLLGNTEEKNINIINQMKVEFE